jgi:cell wall-associated NlpC family hydrolase
MKQLIPLAALWVLVPGAAHAQIDLDLSGSRPVLRASLGSLVLSAGLGSRGVDVSVAERSSGIAWPRRETDTRPSTTRRPRGESPAPPSSRPRPVSTRTGGARATAAGVLATADNYVGTKYVWGGASPGGFDCSGFVQYVFRRHGLELPRTSRQQVQVGERVSTTLSALQPGDLMFFATNGVRIDHIAIYAGDDQIIHSSSSGGGVGYDNLSSKRGRWFSDHHVATRRVLDDGYSLVAPLTAALRAFTEFDPPDRAPRR